ncbi:hypothetical protein ASE92_02760 [Pedobacter sp. Leaf41]|nr:hypothetical protein ASE92_02760 [Pedobacter sp. Leaf41]
MFSKFRKQLFFIRHLVILAKAGILKQYKGNGIKIPRQAEDDDRSWFLEIKIIKKDSRHCLPSTGNDGNNNVNGR